MKAIVLSAKCVSIKNASKADLRKWIVSFPWRRNWIKFPIETEVKEWTNLKKSFSVSCLR